jgi:serine acetyltransferase
MIDDRGYLAQALFERLRSGSIPYCVLGDTRRYAEEVGAVLELAVPRAALAGMPRMVSEFCRDFDLQLVQVLPREPCAYRFVLAWSDDIGRPRFFSLDLCSDFYRGGRLLLRSRDFLSRRRPALEENGLALGFEVPSADVRFVHLLLKQLHAGALAETDGDFLSRLWREDPPGVMEEISRFWPAVADLRRIASAAKSNVWSSLDVALLRRALRPRRTLGTLLGRAKMLLSRVLEPPGAAIAFVGGEPACRSMVLEHVVRDLAPAFPSGLVAVERGYEPPDWRARRPDLWVLFDAEALLPEGAQETIAVDAGRPLQAQIAAVERAILHWLECRVERRYPEACVGSNPLAARLLQWACRSRLPLVAACVNRALHCAIECRMPAPVLMPHPFGIFIDREARIGRRVTVMPQATIARKLPSEPGAPLIEDNVFIGAGARILGAVRIGRGATVGANAVVTRDVPSHCTVVGANRILGQRDAEAVADARREERDSVVNV